MGCSWDVRLSKCDDSVSRYAYHAENDDSHDSEAAGATTDADTTSTVEHESQRDLSDRQQRARYVPESGSDAISSDYCTIRFTTTASPREWRSELHVPADYESPEYAIPVSVEYVGVCSCSSTVEHSGSRGTDGSSRAFIIRRWTSSRD